MHPPFQLDSRLNTIADALQQHAIERPDHTAATFLASETEQAAWTYRKLNERARAVAATLRRMDCSGRTVLLVHPPGLEFIAALYGCFYAGAVAVPTYPPSVRTHSRSDERLRLLINDAKPAIALTTESMLSRVQVWSSRGCVLNPAKWYASDTGDFCMEPEAVENRAELDSVAMLQYTSGSTREPKGVILTHRNLMENQRVIVAQFHHSRSSHMVSWLPPYHDMGLIGGMLQPLTVGFPLTLMPPLFVLQKPVRWIQTMSRVRATTTGSPNSIYQLCLKTIRAEERDNLDLSSWRVAYNGSEPIRFETLKRFTEFFAPCGFRPETFLPCYGLAESTLLVAGRSAVPKVEFFNRQGLENNRATPGSEGAPFVSCGRPGPGYDVAIVDPETGTECERNQIGEIYLSGPSVATGYWNRPEETRATFQNGIACRNGRFLRTGDLGVLLDGELFVTGRLKEIVIIRGRNFYPHDIESCTAASHPDLLFDACIAFSTESDEGERLVIACEFRREARHHLNSAEVVGAIRQAVMEEFDVGVSCVLLLKPGSLPRTTSGKLRRNECRNLFLKGVWNDALQDIPTERSNIAEAPSLADSIRKALSRTLKVPDYWLDDEKPIAALGLDSLMRLEFLFRLESELGQSLDSGLLNADTMNLRELIAVIGQLPRNDGSTQKRQSTPGSCAGDRIPLLPVQHEFLSEFVDEPRQYAILLHLRIDRGTDSDALKRALQELETRHDAFRLRFRRDGDNWVQEAGTQHNGIAFRRIDARNLTGFELKATAQQLNTQIATEFDLAKGPVAQAVFLDRGSRESGVLFLSLHHLIADAVAIARIVFDLEESCQSHTPPAPDVTFNQWASCLEAFAQSKSVRDNMPYWQAMCADQTSFLPTSGQPVADGHVNRLGSEESSRYLERFRTSQEQHDFLLTTLAQAWSKTTEGSSLFVRLENHGRSPIGGKNPLRTVGRFVFHFPMLVAPKNDVASLMRNVPYNGLSYGLLRYLCGDPNLRRAMQELPVPQVGFVYRGRLDDIFSRDRRFPVLRTGIFDGVTRGSTLKPALVLSAGLEGRIVWWRLIRHTQMFQPVFVDRLEEAIRTSLSAS